jgi:hypothetical protein
LKYTPDSVEQEEIMKYVVVFRIPHIKKYVFNTDPLVEIRGASELLAELNLEVSREFLEKKFDHVKCVYVGGGIGQFIIDAPGDQIDRGMQELVELFSRETKGGIQLLYGKSPLVEDNYLHVLRNAMYEMEVQSEEEAVKSSSPVHTGLIRECMSCSGMAATLQTQFDETRILCEICWQKAEYGKLEAKNRLWTGLELYLKRKGIHVKQPPNFEKIGELCSAKKGYTALVYADGNGMGKIVDQIKTAEQFEFFSNTVDESIKEACYEALKEVFFSQNSKQYTMLPAVLLMLGGDDLLVYLTADSAFSFAIKVAEKFNEETKKRFRQYTRQKSFPVKNIAERGLTISLGIAYGKTQTPFSILLDQAEELLVNAKRGGAKDPAAHDWFTPTYIDYHMSTTFNTISVEDCRKNHLEWSNEAEKKRIKLYSKPYSLPQAKKLLSNAKALIESGLPNTRLQRLGSAPFLAVENGSLYKASLECLTLFTRTREEAQRQTIQQILEEFACFTDMPWKKDKNFYSTMLVDLMELADFCINQKAVSKGDNHASY